MNLSASGPVRLISWFVRATVITSNNLIALLPVTFACKEEFELHRHLRAIGKNTLLSKITPAELASQKEVFFTSGFYIYFIFRLSSDN